jgi:hypothetical protein
MASNWTGTLFVYADSGGQQYVGITLPEGAVIPADDIRTYRSTGPHLPTGFPQSIAVDDADQWIHERKNEGFNFELLDD